MDEPRPQGRPGPRLLLAAAVILAPWIWFLVRDLGGDLDAVAVALPGIGAIALLGLGLVAALRRRLLPLLALRSAPWPRSGRGSPGATRRPMTPYASRW
jgi:hypothetical protein